MRREILKLSAGWVFCAAALAVCGGEKISDKELGGEVSLPEGWTGYPYSINYHKQYVRRIGAKSSDQKASIEIRVDEVEAGSGLLSCFEMYILGKPTRDSVLTNIQMSKVAGRDALKVEVDEPWTAPCHLVYYYVVAGTRGYSICCRAPKSNFDKYAKEIDAIVASFKIIEPK